MYSHLLIAIAKKIGVRGEKTYYFAEGEKLNFRLCIEGLLDT